MSDTENSRIINHSRVILRYLQDLHSQQKPLLLSVPFSGSERLYESTIQKLDESGHFMVLGMFMPAELIRQGIFPLATGVKTQLDHGLLDFMTHIYPADDSGKPSQCLMHCPVELVKNQLRAAFRVSLLRYEATLSCVHDQDMFNGSCLDISQGGVLASFDEDNASLHKGMVIETCRIDIPGYLTLDCKAEVCRLERGPKSQVQAGLHFPDLPESSRRQIARTLITLERDALRHTSRPGERVSSSM